MKEARPTGDYDALYRSYIAALKQIDHLSTIREIGLAINSSLELDEILPTVAEVVQDGLDVRKLAIFVLGKDGENAHPVVAKYGRDLILKERLQEEMTPVRGTPLGDALKTRLPVLVNTQYQSTAFVPLIANNAAVGVMRLEDPRSSDAFTQEDAVLFQSVGSQIATALNNAQLYALAVTDGLTGLYVRRYFDLRMDEEFEQATRYHRDFSLLMFDIDHFKKFNDTHGHQTGDMVLQQFATLLQSNTRKSDICCRYGGEEMCVILPETRLEEAAILANKLCETIRSHVFHGIEEKELKVTSSIGVAQYEEDFSGPRDMVQATDQALYKAKELGRNRVELAGI